MTVVALPRKFGPEIPKHVFRRVKYLRQAPAAVVALPVRTDAAQAYSLYMRAVEVDEVDIAAGLALYERAIALDPKLALAYTNLGNCHFRLGRADLARGFFMKAIEVDPTQPEAHHNLGYLKLEAGDIAGAIPLLEAAVKLDPVFADAWYNLGIAHEQRLGTHRSPLIRVCFQRYLKLAGPDESYTEQARRRLA